MIWHLFLRSRAWNLCCFALIWIHVRLWSFNCVFIRNQVDIISKIKFKMCPDFMDFEELQSVNSIADCLCPMFWVLLFGLNLFVVKVNCSNKTRPWTWCTETELESKGQFLLEPFVLIRIFVQSKYVWVLKIGQKWLFQ